MCAAANSRSLRSRTRHSQRTTSRSFSPWRTCHPVPLQMGHDSVAVVIKLILSSVPAQDDQRHSEADQQDAGPAGAVQTLAEEERASNSSRNITQRGYRNNEADVLHLQDA